MGSAMHARCLFIIMLQTKSKNRAEDLTPFEQQFGVGVGQERPHSRAGRPPQRTGGVLTPRIRSSDFLGKDRADDRGMFVLGEFNGDTR